MDRYVPGFCGAKARGLGAKGAMTNDNADLVGYAFPVEGGVATVTGTARWNPLYVEVATPEGPSVRVAGQVRRRRELA